MSVLYQPEWHSAVETSQKQNVQAGTANNQAQPQSSTRLETSLLETWNLCSLSANQDWILIFILTLEPGQDSPCSLIPCVDSQPDKREYPGVGGHDSNSLRGLQKANVIARGMLWANVSAWLPGRLGSQSAAAGQSYETSHWQFALSCGYARLRCASKYCESQISWGSWTRPTCRTSQAYQQALPKHFQILLKRRVGEG